VEPDSLDHIQATSTEPSEWSVKNIVGLVGIILMVIFMIASFALMGSSKSKTAKLRILRVFLARNDSDTGVDKTQSSEDRSDLPLAAVIKVNSEHPKHFVMPVTEGEEPNTATSPLCIFEMEPNSFEKTSFSLILREGNIPIHFETISGGKFLKNARTKRLEFKNVQEKEHKLTGKTIVITFEINL